MEGRVQKIAKDRALLEAAFVRDTNKTVRQHVQEVVAQLGENIQVQALQPLNCCANDWQCTSHLHVID